MTDSAVDRSDSVYYTEAVSGDYMHTSEESCGLPVYMQRNAWRHADGAVDVYMYFWYKA